MSVLLLVTAPFRLHSDGMSEAASPIFSIITTCKGRLNHLRQTLPAMAGQPGVEVVVVDYACPEGTADWVNRHFPSVKTVEVENQPTFNTSHARNLGAAAATGTWLCFMDADVTPGPEFAAHFAQRLVPGRFFTAAPFAPEICGTCVVPRRAYRRAGGYDEAMEPWSYEDKDLYVRLKQMGLVEDHYPAALIAVISHGDEDRMQFVDSDDRWETMRRNALYHHAKLLAMRALRRPLDIDWRRQLYADIKRLVAENPDRSEITIRLPDIPPAEVAPGRRIEASIVVTLLSDEPRPQPRSRSL
jgi:glycosyltransferase involved in cell wall biosynthesis